MFRPRECVCLRTELTRLPVKLYFSWHNCFLCLKFYPFQDTLTAARKYSRRTTTVSILLFTFNLKLYHKNVKNPSALAYPVALEIYLFHILLYVLEGPPICQSRFGSTNAESAANISHPLKQLDEIFTPQQQVALAPNQSQDAIH